MKEKPIIFGTWAIPKILDKSKTQTRRVMKLQPELCQKEYEKQTKYFVNPLYEKKGNKEYHHPFISEKQYIIDYCPYQIGQTLWVRETWGEIGIYDDAGMRTDIIYKADNYNYRDNPKWKPSIFMPRKAARLFLIVTGRRVERIQDITIDDCWKEGIDGKLAEKLPYLNKWGVNCAESVFSNLWDSINKKRGYGWDVNPWVWRIVFKVKTFKKNKKCLT